MLKRLRRLIALSKKDPNALKKLEGLTDEQMAIIPEVGNGKAEFFGPGTEEEFKEQERKDKFGVKKLFGL